MPDANAARRSPRTCGARNETLGVCCTREPHPDAQQHEAPLATGDPTTTATVEWRTRRG